MIFFLKLKVLVSPTYSRKILKVFTHKIKTSQKKIPYLLNKTGKVKIKSIVETLFPVSNYARINYIK